ncbi:hypothetical protein DITRI_Ditri01bG0141900 [Diplodiscus trichospermus]
MKDAVIWKSSVSGCFRVRQLCNDFNIHGGQNRSTWKLLWSGCAPPKVEPFCWSLVGELNGVPLEIHLHFFLAWQSPCLVASVIKSGGLLFVLVFGPFGYIEMMRCSMALIQTGID